MDKPRKKQVGGTHYLDAEVQPDEVLRAIARVGELDGLRFAIAVSVATLLWRGCLDADKARHHVSLIAALSENDILAYGYHLGCIIKRALRTPAGQSPERDEIVRACVDLVKGGRDD